MHAGIQSYVQSTCLCRFIYTAVNVSAAAICIRLAAKTRFLHLPHGMGGRPNMDVCRITGNSYGLFSPNNSVGASSDTSAETVGKTMSPR